VEQRVVEDPVFRQRLAFEPADGGRSLRVEVWVDPGGGVPPHVHPAMEERFEVVSGHPEFLAGRKWATAAPGDVVVVPPGTRHAYRNRGDELAHVVCLASPPSTLQEFLEEAAAMSRAGKLTRQGLPKSPRAAMEAFALAKRHQDMCVMSFPPAPPLPVQRLLWTFTRTAAGRS
jgi:quercetin dioxygenase-like cupin family protein